MKREFCISAPQLFWLSFSYVLGGLILHCEGDFASALFACLFSVCLCIIANALCYGRGSFSALLERLPVGISGIVRGLGVFLVSIPLAAAGLSFSEVASAFYQSASPYVLLAFLAAICVFTLWKGFTSASRFAETLAFPLAVLLLLSMLGGNGDGLRFDFAAEELFGGALIIGSAVVFFTLYLRCIGKDSGHMSRFAESSAFHPSPLACGIVGVLSATAVYFWLCFAGASAILPTFFAWFFCLGRLFALCICACDVLALPEISDAAQKVRRVTGFCVLCFAVAAFYGAYSSVFGAAALMGNVLFPCTAWALSFVLINKKTPV